MIRFKYDKFLSQFSVLDQKDVIAQNTEHLKQAKTKRDTRATSRAWIEYVPIVPDNAAPAPH